MPKVAKLAIQSNLPQLDRLFDYLIPEELFEKAVIGSRVRVLFGRSKKPLDAFIVELAESSDFAGKLSEVLEVVGVGAALQPNVFLLCRALADRSATTLGELTKLAIPPHMPRSTAGDDAGSAPVQISDSTFLGAAEQQGFVRGGEKSFVLAQPREVNGGFGANGYQCPAWTALFVLLAINNLREGKSTIALVPDYREHEVLLEALLSAGLESFVANYSQEQPKSKQYSGFLRALETHPRIIIGSRAAAFAPAHNLGSILVFDEADSSYADQAAPYLNTRDVVLVRQSIENCSLVFASHSVSCDMRRLLDSGFLTDRTIPFAAPSVSISEPGMRVDSHAYRAIKTGLETGPVLVQVASTGDTTALYCKSCDAGAKCSDCGGPLWIDGSGAKKCRWCNSFQLNHVCECGSSEMSMGRAGSTRTAAELGRAFPNARVVESIGTGRTTRVQRGQTLVVATAGAEPYVEGGYDAVVLLDAKVALSRQYLKAQEEAVRSWSNAVAKAAPKAPCVLVGVSGELSKLFSLWNHTKISEIEYRGRQELKLPPALRMGSITGELELVTEIAQLVSQNTSLDVIGPAPLEAGSGQSLWRLIIKYPYSEGLSLAKLLKLETARLSAGKTRTSSSGRTGRAITLKMNDAEVV